MVKTTPQAALDETPVCQHFQEAADLIGKRWTPQIVRALQVEGGLRFCRLREAAAPISDALLSTRLKELEREGIIERTVSPTTPVLITYALTPDGQELGIVMASLATWAEARGRAAT